MNTAYAVMLAQPGGDWGHMWGTQTGAWMWLWAPLMMLLWIVLVGAVVWLIVRAVTPGQRSSAPSGEERAKDILAERYARGELTTEEFQERLEQLQH